MNLFSLDISGFIHIISLTNIYNSLIKVRSFFNIIWRVVIRKKNYWSSWDLNYFLEISMDPKLNLSKMCYESSAKLVFTKVSYRSIMVLEFSSTNIYKSLCLRIFPNQFKMGSTIITANHMYVNFRNNSSPRVKQAYFLLNLCLVITKKIYWSIWDLLYN